MKKLIILSIITVVCFNAARAQQLPLYSQYLMNGFLLNPAMAGCEDYVPIRVTARQQWSNLNDKPETFAISGHSAFAGQSMGIGGYLYADRFGPISRTGIMASYAYHMNLHRIDSRLSFGLSLSAFQYKVDQSSLTLADSYDEAITGAVETAFAPDASFGAYLYRHNYYVGIASTQLIEYKVGINQYNENEMIRHYFLMGGYRFKINDKFELEPSILLKGTEKTPGQIDVNLKGILMKNYWFALSYRTPDVVVAMVGVKYKMAYIGYAFDYTFSSIANYSTGSHEILLGVNLGENKIRGNSLL